MVASILHLQRRDFKKLGRNFDEYGIHKLIYSLFPGEKRSFLFLDKGGRYGEKQILIVSQEPPVKNDIGEIQSKTIPENFLDYQDYAFEVKLNPVKRLSASGKAVPILGEKALKDWFFARQKTWGFDTSPEYLEVSETGLQQFQRGSHSISHNKATFKGLLTVQDKALFKDSFAKGIGRGKAFGFGLLQLNPIKTKKGEDHDK